MLEEMIFDKIKGNVYNQICTFAHQAIRPTDSILLSMAILYSVSRTRFLPSLPIVVNEDNATISRRYMYTANIHIDTM